MIKLIVRSQDLIGLINNCNNNNNSTNNNMHHFILSHYKWLRCGLFHAIDFDSYCQREGKTTSTFDAANNVNYKRANIQTIWNGSWQKNYCFICISYELAILRAIFRWEKRKLIRQHTHAWLSQTSNNNNRRKNPLNDRTCILM